MPPVANAETGVFHQDLSSSSICFVNGFDGFMKPLVLPVKSNLPPPLGELISLGSTGASAMDMTFACSQKLSELGLE